MSTVSSPPESGNRVAGAIEALRNKIAQRIGDGITTQADIDALHKTLNMSLLEFCRFQERKSAAMGSRLNEAEAQLIYHYLGNTPEHFNGQPIEVKTVLTQVFAELLAGGGAA
jgi:hypothetical protein